MTFSLPVLPYGYDALEPYIDIRTMQFHHTKHHQAYIDNLNQAVARTGIATAVGTEQVLLDNLLKTVSGYNTIIRNNAGGHFNHWFFWNSLMPNSSRIPGISLFGALEKSFGSFALFKKVFSDIAVARFGSGWTWLSVSQKDGSLIIFSTANQDNPLMDILPLPEQAIPILGLDVWEHAYYLLYQNRRLAYIEAFWEIINWEVVESRFIEATQNL